MKCFLCSAAVMLIAGSVIAAEPKEEVQNAAKALAEKENYSWTTKTEISRDTQTFQTESTGMSEKDGFTHVSMPIRDNTIEIVMKGEKGAVRTQDGWRSFAELQSDSENQRGRFLARMVQSMRGPAKEAEELAGKVEELTKTDDGYAGKLTEEGAQELLVSGRGRGGNAQASNAKGAVRFWVEDGVLTKYSYEVEGTVSRDGNETNVKRSAEVQIRDVGTTKVVVPEEAKNKIS